MKMFIIFFKCIDSALIKAEGRRRVGSKIVSSNVHAAWQTNKQTNDSHINKFITNKMHFTMNRETILYYPAIIYSHIQEQQLTKAYTAFVNCTW